jgi:hypothetical protein
MPDPTELSPEPTATAVQLAKALDDVGIDYAVGGAIALTFWSEPRATVDVDITLFWPDTDYARALDMLQTMGCEFQRRRALETIYEYGFCKTDRNGVRVDVFFPMMPFISQARDRRERVTLGGQPLTVWKAEPLAVLKMMFFRRKDLADVEQLIRIQGNQLDRNWVRAQLVEIFGARDPRIPAWDELVAEVGG